MKKMMFLVFVVLFTMSCAQGHRHSDFFGTWIGENEDGKAELTITETTFSMEVTPRNVSLPNIRIVYEIFSLESVTNNDPSTSADYPEGFLFGLRNPLGNDTFTFFMSHNRNSVISSAARDVVYVRNSGSFIGKENELFNLISTIAGNFPTTEEQAIAFLDSKGFTPDHGLHYLIFNEVKISVLPLMRTNRSSVDVFFEFTNEEMRENRFDGLISYLRARYTEERFYNETGLSFDYRTSNNINIYGIRSSDESVMHIVISPPRE